LRHFRRGDCQTDEHEGYQENYGEQDVTGFAVSIVIELGVALHVA